MMFILVCSQENVQSGTHDRYSSRFCFPKPGFICIPGSVATAGSEADLGFKAVTPNNGQKNDHVKYFFHNKV